MIEIRFKPSEYGLFPKDRHDPTTMITVDNGTDATLPPLVNLQFYCADGREFNEALPNHVALELAIRLIDAVNVDVREAVKFFDLKEWEK